MQTTHIKSIETFNSGGNCMIDIIELKSGKILTLNEDCVVFYLSREEAELALAGNVEPEVESLIWL